MPNHFDAAEAGRKLLSLGSLELGCGPDHPESPRSELRGTIESFITQHNFLRGHPDYVSFLLAYPGAGRTNDDPRSDDFLFLSMYGFTEGANYAFLESEYDTIDDHGFFGFCDVQYRYRPYVEGPGSILNGLTTAQFMFDATESRTRGVYVDSYIDGQGKLGASEGRWYCGSFAEWLVSLVSHRGRIPTVNWLTG